MPQNCLGFFARQTGAPHPGPAVLNFLKALLSASLGAVLGLTATYYSVERGLGFGAVQAGPWTVWPRSGSPEADPYARATLARTGELPLGLAEGLTFIARGDSSGAPLSNDCIYQIAGQMPPARFWTLSTATRDGGLIANSAGRYGFTSAEILRAAGGAFSITVSRGVQPGNWLPLGSADGFLLVLRFYDTPVSATASALNAAIMPLITKNGCP